MQVGDKIDIRGVLYTIWLIENGIYHLINDDGYGICGDLDFITQIMKDQ